MSVFNFKPATPETHPHLVKVIDGELCLSPRAVALLSGTTETEVREVHRQNTANGRMWVPKHWYRKAQEDMARLNCDDMYVILAILDSERAGGAA